VNLASLPVEARVLLACARVKLDERQSETLQNLLRNSAVPWNDLLHLAARHALLPLLYWNLSQAAKDLVPQDIFEKLLRTFERNTARNLFLARELSRLLALFEQENIPVIAWRGPVLASCVYKNISLRYFADLDLFAEKGDIKKIQALLIKEGYRLALTLNEAEEAALLKLHYTFDFDRIDGRAHLEVHWHIVPSYFHFELNTKALWQRLVKVSMNGMQLATLSPEDFLLIQSVHNAKHQWDRLAWITDFAEIISASPEIDWKETVERAEQSHSLRMLLLGLHLSNDLLDAPLPEFVLKAIESDKNVKLLAERVVQLMFAPIEEQQGFLEEATFQRFHYQVRERFGDKFAYWLKSFTSPSIEDWASIKLPASLFFLYSFIRPFRLTAKYLKKLLTAK
jgi:Uncharacterised nucleotidyltransferase